MAATPLDPTDRQLIEALQRDGRASYADLAELVGLSPAATRLRVQRLLDAGVVQVVGVTDPLALGYPVMAALGVRVDRNVRDVADRIAGIGGVIYVVFTSGSFDLLVEVLCEDSARLLAVIDDEIRSIPDVR
ncbi:MAG TPA: Lrp/AsnC family transcriptional regulator, partial [Ilumatobacteraceae bacterium]|nr:Lrp/AsnC family transcriptional regulator [Ilumatobacteraceae bacterium]